MPSGVYYYDRLKEVCGDRMTPVDAAHMTSACIIMATRLMAQATGSNASDESLFEIRDGILDYMGRYFKGIPTKN